MSPGNLVYVFSMIFASPVFLFYFLPAFLAVYTLTPARGRGAAIFLGSSVFYAWWRLDFLFLLWGVTGFTWLTGLALEKWRRKPLLVFGIAANLAVLGYFKYWNFGVNGFQAIFIKAGDPPPGIAEVILPLGISFFVLHAISYLIDIWRGSTPASRSLTDFAAFLMMFPHLIAGPVLRYKDMARQFRERRHGADLFSEGACRFMTGFSKKVLIADSLAPLADAAFALDAPTFCESWIGVVAYAVQLYFDFSGYSEMAVGLGLMMGFRLVENFNAPYASKSVTEFWRRWHISLSTWLRDYLYIPLGGNRRGRARTWLNLFLVMLLGGVWHGANWTFLLWGGWHGILLLGERLKKNSPAAPAGGVHMDFRLRGNDGSAAQACRLFSHLYCLLAVLIGWVMFRAPDVGTALNFYNGMAAANGMGLTDSLLPEIRGAALCALAAGIGLIALQPFLTRWREPVELPGGSLALRFTPPVAVQILLCAVFVLAVTRLIAEQTSPFLYFQF